MATSVEEHAALVASLVEPRLAQIEPETVPLLQALGRVLSSDVLSPVDLPLFRNSQMDGFAVRATDATPTTTLPVEGVIAAAVGSPPALAPRTALRIMTGAPVPDGADTIIPVEDTTVDGDSVVIHRGRAAGEFVRERGSDIRAGELLLTAGTMLASRHLAALAAAGITRVSVLGRPTVAIVTTGAELLDPGAEPQPGQVFDSNSVALVAAVTAAGGEVTLVRRVVDDPAQLLAVLDEATGADVIVTSGGISHGDFEVVRELLEPRGARVGHVAMQPGGPQATAVFEGVPVISFPGNPVSTQVSFEVFLAPLLRAAAGLPAADRRPRRLAGPVRSVAGKRQFLRGRGVGADGVEIVAGPGSHLVAGLAASDLLVIVPEDVTELAGGETVETWAL
ncbi:molybdopterin molybdotransferase [Microbacteriaceae bacterium SG_E_30_P1]|uniref:Molybdopterin molybdenumtransferase n=1 Tax=Antiquaquibacter oligotrophicus TaxID=2880260 RepID=A0ABT6KNF1_9MICO|nr:gephyrin-like molybdotransferase Glp [Antiquaquibacter oligotrophicus]MDH6181536.1 molybdopterin molybdotransferase [Antiquaquibacter oligotrophicus]UDF12775.1 molybdopterin molybdotransferase MoeA [Antiquaquibacter oligotrophicus]